MGYVKMSVEFDRKDRAILHPLLAAVSEGKKVTKLVVTRQFTDDHLPCVEASVTCGGKVYRIGDWWLSHRGVASWYRAEANREAREKLIQYLLRNSKRIVKDHNEHMTELDAADLDRNTKKK